MITTPYTFDFNQGGDTVNGVTVEYQPHGNSTTVSVANLPTHVMYRTSEIAGGEEGAEVESGGEEGAEGYVIEHIWKTHSGSTLTFQVNGVPEGESEENGGEEEEGGNIVIEIWNPTISASGGGGGMTEAGNANGTGFGSGSATFTVSRDMPTGYSGPSGGDDPMPATTISVVRGGNATFNSDYTAAPGYNSLPSGNITIPEGVQVSKEYKVIPIDDNITETEPAQPTLTDAIFWDVITNPIDNTHVVLTSNILDDSGATSFIVDSNVPGASTVALNSEVVYPGYLDPAQEREIATWQEINTYDPVGVENTSLAWGASASYSGSLSWSEQITTSVSIGSQTIPNIVLNIGRSQTAGVTSNYADYKWASSREKWKLELYINHRKYVKVLARQQKDQNGNWYYTGASMETVLAEGDVPGQFAYKRSVSRWQDEEASA